MPAIRLHLNNLHALIIRDMMTRFGRNNLGFIWTILEPMILCTGVMTIWSLIHDSVIRGIPIISFVLTGYMPLTLWRHMTNPLVRVISNNAGLLYHTYLTHLDIVIARQVLEFLSSTAALVLIYLILLSLGLAEPVQDMGLLLAAWLLIGWFHSGIGLIIAALTEKYERAEKFVGPANYLALPISGVFFMVDWLPSNAQRLIAWNPTIHGFEMFRAGFFGESVATHYDPLYLGLWSLALTVIGNAAVQIARDHVHA